MSDVNNVAWSVSTFLVWSDDGRFEVGQKADDFAEFVVDKSFTDLDEARDFAKELTVRKNESAFVEVRGRFEDDGHVVCFLEEE